MTTTLTIRLPVRLARELKSKAAAEKTSPTAVLRQAATEYVRRRPRKDSLNALQRHIDAHAGTWDGDISGAELLRLTRP